MKIYNGDIMEVIDEDVSLCHKYNVATMHSYHCARVASNIELVKVSKHRYAIKDSINSKSDLILRKLLIVTDNVINDRKKGLGLYVDKDSVKEVARVKLPNKNK